MRIRGLTIVAMALAVALAAACGSGDGSSGETPQSTASRAARAGSPTRPAATVEGTAEPATTAEPASSDAPVQPASSPPTAGQGSSAAPRPADTPEPPAAVVRVYSPQQGAAQVNAGSLTPADLPLGWVVQSDAPNTPVGDDAAVCGQLAGRTIASLPADPIAAFLAGGTLSFFSNVTAYATEAGAIECANRAASRFATPGDLARAFGSLFVNPDAVVVAAFSYPQVADGSIAGTLTGQVNASGTVIDLTVLFVGFRKGNVTAVIGSARSGSVPPADELTPLINLVIGRIAAQQ